MSNDTGGTVFPTAEANYWNENMRSDGMTQRDYMAIHASEADVQRFMEYDAFISRQQARYMHADAMIAERNK